MGMEQEQEQVLESEKGMGMEQEQVLESVLESELGFLSQDCRWFHQVG